MTTYTRQQLEAHAGPGASLELIGHNEDGKPVFAGYWDCGTPCVMVGEPGDWFSAWDGDSAPERYEDELHSATLVAEAICGISQKNRRRRNRKKRSV